MPDNTALQISALTRLWKRQLATVPPQLTTDQLLAKAAGAGATMEDGVEVIRISFDSGSTEGVLAYPKEVVMTAALDLLDALEAPSLGTANPNVIHSNFGFTRVET